MVEVPTRGSYDVENVGILNICMHLNIHVSFVSTIYMTKSKVILHGGLIYHA